MRTIFVLLVYFYLTDTLATKEALNGVSSITVTHNKPGLKGSSNTKNVVITGSNEAPRHTTVEAPKDHFVNVTGGLNSSTSRLVAGAPVHQILDETHMLQHMGREHVIKGNNATVSNTSAVPLAAEEKTTPHQNHVVPKKGVSNSTSKVDVNNVTHSNVSANITVIHKKPLILESDLDNSIEQQTEPKEIPISITQIDPSLINTKPKRADYIIPIVGVIFSVPVVAILISIVYKRGTDWWRYRNYKRMDFLIEGMYQ